MEIKKIIAIMLLIIICIITIGSVGMGISNQFKTVKVVSNDVIVEQEVAEENTITAAAEVEETFTAMYTITVLNVRTGPGTGNSIYKTVPVNTELQLVDNYNKVDDWVQIKYEDNYYYVNSKYLSTQKIVIKSTTRSGSSLSSSDAVRSVAAQGVQWIYTGDYTITYYCSCEKCCGKYASGKTASGTTATAGRTIAASKEFAFGTKLNINGHVYVVEDRGGAIKGNKIDIYVDSHAEALALGKKKNVPVYLAQGG